MNFTPKAHAKEPRLKPVNYSPVNQADELQMMLLAREWREHHLPLPEVIARINRNPGVIRVKQTPFVVDIQINDTPYLLIPYNPGRTSILLTSQIGPFFMSYGYPVRTRDLFLGTYEYGIAMVFNTFAAGFQPIYQERNGVVSTDDIYVTQDGNSFFPGVPNLVLGFEGVVAVEAN
jgi:hypothetical protein